MKETNFDIFMGVICLISLIVGIIEKVDIFTLIWVFNTLVWVGIANLRGRKR